MHWLIYVHLGVAIILLAGALALAIEAVRSRRLSALPERFWKGATHLERGIFLQAAIGVVLFLTTRHQGLTWTHYLYGGVALVVVLIERGLRPGRGLRETLTTDYGRFNEPVVLAILMFFLFGVFGRAFTTGMWNV
ncbi:MAG: hypothetical protein M1516_02280 [Firmicutes bacterium]|jgi:hypothetical protein|nr:hypothetical protein [Bacillota bacterium]